MHFNIDQNTNISFTLKQIGDYLNTFMDKGIVQAELLTVCSEIINNIRNHANHGSLVITPHEREVYIIAKDNGRGFKDIELILKEGFSTANSLGIGVPAIIRLSDQFEACSNADGVELRVTKVLR